MPAPRKPQDHKPKARTAKDIAATNGLVPFTFDHDGNTYNLPAPDADALEKVTGQIIHDAVMNPDDEGAQTRLGMATIDASIDDPDLLKVLYSKPWGELSEILLAWMRHHGTDPGKSPASSD